MIPFLYVLVTRKRPTLTTKAYRKPNHTGCYLNFIPVFDPRLKEELFRDYKIVITICQE
jgi:hypothetical protein